MIKDEDISVVIQGPILGEKERRIEKQITKNVCLNVRYFLPKAEIIVSTWKGSNIEGLVYDKIVLNEDPGSIIMTLNEQKRENNTNRMIVSTINGLRKATRKYVIKMRSDLYFENLNFIKKFENYRQIKKNKVLTSNFLTLSANHYKRGSEIIFTLNDWFMFGKTEDIIKIWDIPLQKDFKFFKKTEVPKFEDNLIGEEYIWTSFLKKDREYKKILRKNRYKVPVTKNNIKWSEKALAEYTIIYNGKDLGLNSYKYPNKNYVRRDFAKASCYTHLEWLKLQKKHINSKMKGESRFRDIFDIVMYKITFKILQKKYNFIYKKIRNVIKK